MAPILIATDDHYGTLAAVRGLRAGGYEPIVAAPGRLTYAALSRAASRVLIVPPAAADPEAFVAALARAALASGAAAVLPGGEDSLLALAGREQAFSVPVGTGRPESVARASDKRALAELAATGGVPSPTTRVVEATAVDDVEFPAIVKPVTSMIERGDGSLHRGWARRVEDRQGLREAITAFGGRGVVQPVVDGKLYAVGGVAWEGRLVCSVHQVALRLWPPRIGGSSFAVTVAPDVAVEASLATVLSELAWSGLFHAQLIQREGGYHLIDLNLRVYGSLGLAIGSGLNLPAIWADLVLGREPRPSGYRVGVFFRAPEKDARALLLDLRSGRRRAALCGALPHRPGVQSVFSRSDPLPLAGTVVKTLALFRRRS